MAKLQPELSYKNLYWIPKHRYYELKHFCLQYMDWMEKYNHTDILRSASMVKLDISKFIADSSVEQCAIETARLSEHMKLIETVAHQADPELEDFIFTAVTRGISYDIMSARYEVPCGRDLWYSRIRKFYWILDKCRT